MRTSQNFDFICESISILPFLFISSLPTLSSLFCMELWLANFLGKGKIYSSKSSRWTATLAVDFSSKCYLFCECNVVRISQNIQNVISLDTFCDVVAYKFIDINWKLNGFRKKICMITRRSIWSDNDQSSRRRFKAIEITMLEGHV